MAYLLRSYPHRCNLSSERRRRLLSGFPLSSRQIAAANCWASRSSSASIIANARLAFLAGVLLPRHHPPSGHPCLAGRPRPSPAAGPQLGPRQAMAASTRHGRCPEEDNSLVAVAEAEAEAAAAAAGRLTGDLIVEILSRLPVRSVHRFKCVCKLWRDLIARPAHRKKLPQTLAGFLYSTYPGGYRHHLASVSETTVVDSVDASLDFLRPMNYTMIRLVDACNGLVLCSCYHEDSDEQRLVVCNPATQRWTELPPPPQPQPTTDYCAQHLAFDPAVSPSHFYVLDFEGTVKEWHLKGVSIYSSRTGAWTHRDTGLVDKIVLTSGSVFVGGMLHLPGKVCKDGLNSIEDVDNFVLVVVDMECKAWKTVRAPSGFYSGAIGWSQGRLHYVTRSPSPLTVLDDDDEDTLLLATEIAVWCLEDYGSQKWALKHTVRIDKLLDVIQMEYYVVGIHPDCDTIFFVTRGAYDGDSWDDASLASWDMRRLEFRTVLDLEKGSAGIYLPYVPMFSELTLADGDVL